MKYPLVIIGAGAAGLLAAIRAAECGVPVQVLEKMPSAGRKILISGAGRCNVTNSAALESFVSHYFKNGRFLYPAFHRFFRPELISLLQSQKVALITEPSGKLFPASGQAAEIVEALMTRARNAGVRFLFDDPVQEVVQEHGMITGVRTGKLILPASSVVLAAGGASWPSTGSDGDSYRLAALLGHRIVPTRPALVPMITPEPAIRRLSGLSCPDVGARLLKGRQNCGKAEGDLLFTHFGLSGPVILRLSRDYQDIPQGEGRIELNLLTRYSKAELLRRLSEKCQAAPHRQLVNALGGELLPQALMQTILTLAGLTPDQTAGQAGQTTPGILETIAQTAQHLMIPVTRTRGYRDAMTTAGGIDLREVDPQTMESRIVKGFYPVGEALDLDGDTGGYNLQAAFSTGWLAGDSAAQVWLNRK